MRTGGLKYKTSLSQVVLNEIPFFKRRNCVIQSISVDGRQDY